MRSEPVVPQHSLYPAEDRQSTDRIARSAVLGRAPQNPGSKPSTEGVVTDTRPVRPCTEDLQTADLQAALSQGELSLVYQPILSAATGAITGCEALLRWNHPSLGPISPAFFVPLAERTGDIVPIGAWVLDTACRQAAAWPAICRVSVNVSPVQMQEPGFATRVAAALRASGLAAGRLELELTESVLMGDAAVALDHIMGIRALGVSVALDDFGTGFSSLGYLQRFAFDRIKIDRSFIKALGKGRESRFLITTMHDIAHHFGMAVTAEGIETEDEARTLRDIGSAELQGFLFSQPLANEAVVSLLREEAHRQRRGNVGRQPRSSRHAAP
ncbi:bifunctional diguanylate cyclase/phosphodiesterase [Methylobacterium sp. R2-1]|uniref:putative bifunctional diguanylate cyclase/phosphodiesterase n=1 Tax=Methylobacterium sp. R2-1 TaxID=2587064 RepID=UPI001608BBC4|nr:EAL domain-containing protein [Methylobacterium sp. R2-1]MBB2960438.1 EAL domain-containing protein (putative c-di-GMP-specific phosphodiesterase class I) [Methylobacterium sp. R2-1]